MPMTIKYTAFSADLCAYLAHRDKAHLAKYVKRETVPAEALAVLDFLPIYFESTTDEDVDWHQLEKLAELNGVTLDPEMVKYLHSYGTASSLTDSAIQVYIDMHFADMCVDYCTKVASMGAGAKGLAKVQDILDAHRRDSVSLSREIVAEPSGDIEEAFEKRTGIDWPLKCLNAMLGPVSDEFIIVASRPDGGKTTFLAQIAVNAAKRIPEDCYVLWFNNEESIRKVKSRVITSATGLTREEIETDPLTAKLLYNREVGDNKIIFVDDTFSAGKVERVISNYKPGFIVIDQLYNMDSMSVVVSGKNRESEAEKFKKLCEWARNVAKHNCPVVASNQLDGSAEGQKTPNMGMLYGSKTGAQGAADAILMIGRDYATPDLRYLSTPKNKLTGKVLFATVELDKERACYVNI